MSDVIDIDNLEFVVLDDEGFTDEMTAKVKMLAKLGQSAISIMDNEGIDLCDGRYEFKESVCCTSCDWYKFCKLRKEMDK